MRRISRGRNTMSFLLLVYLQTARQGNATTFGHKLEHVTKRDGSISQSRQLLWREIGRLSIRQLLLALLVHSVVAEDQDAAGDDPHTDEAELQAMSQDEPGAISLTVKVGCHGLCSKRVSAVGAISDNSRKDWCPLTPPRFPTPI